ncbi:MAG TPA: porphobilinogen synthase [Nitrosopumilus sp.]|jgi:porphobilinogen synthase|nr:porphobilinogen synthase [Nitrosopumilus sp.]HJO31570.1 porphobilinogen synthase [Nitrosopumilus sp.]|tara:strand:- start:3175 stop:4155 length:981 start_codon:yes stop_codon:yes gene_type:complete
MSFPTKRLRRIRTSEKMRELIQQTRLSPKDFICPVFVQEDLKTRIKIESMTEIERLPIDDINDEVGTISDLGIPAIMLFGIPTQKDEAGTSAFDDNGIVQKTISQIRKNFGDKIVIMADVCLCQFTSTGHCGIVQGNKIDNDISLDTLAKIAVSQARAGVDTVSPSAMMDGQVAAIRKALDDDGFTDVSIMSHSAKHRSNFYAPFRNAAECAPKFGDRKTYQVPYTNAREAMMEIESDINEGVDIVMVKPALSYLDIIAETRKKFNVPISAYSVSGEYALVKAASQLGYVNEDNITSEILTSIKRAGADMMVTYFAKSASRFLQQS